MARKVTRTWYNKKLGKYITKTYEYNHPSKKGLTLVDKRGRILTKNVTTFKESILNNTDFNEPQKRALIDDLNMYVQERHKHKNKLTTTGFMGTQSNTDITRFLANAGYSVEELAGEIGENEDEILNENNWYDNMLHINGRTFKFNWTYTGNFIEEV